MQLTELPETRLRPRTLAKIRLANQVIDEYAQMGFTLTLRQLFYQFVSRDWIEKDALANVFERACAPYEVPFVSTRGYSSLSLVNGAVQRFVRYRLAGQRVIVLHFADHDPSGLDMTRDLITRFREVERLYTSAWSSDTERIALTLEQVEEHSPPPNYAKVTDSRHASYVRQCGTRECWELDALAPQVLAGLVQKQIDALIDHDAWAEGVARDDEARESLRRHAEHFGGGAA